MLQEVLRCTDSNLFYMSSFNGKRKHSGDSFNGYHQHQEFNTWGETALALHGASSNLHSSDNALEKSIFSMPGTSRDNNLSLPVSPHDQHHHDSANSSVYFTSDHFSGSDNETDDPPKKKRHPVPDNKKDDKYWQRRQKNNMAAKRSREMKKRKVEEELLKAQEAIAENTQLKQEVEVLKAEISSLRRLLKDANMTLSLWIKARQASEAPSKLPPMIRNPNNMPYVTFPVTSSNLP